jgi:pSer/pThr/pTyr-binding forkhead associated (FHA) protein
VGSADFPAWFGASLYGGLACAVLSALVIAGWAILRRRGMSGQVVGALLTCLIASALDAAPIVWTQDRLGVYGPSLSSGEVVAALTFTALCGWATPLGAMIWYVLFAVPISGSYAVGGRLRKVSAPQLVNPGRQRFALSNGLAWGTLAPEPVAPDSRLIPLIHEIILIGRDPGVDLTLVDERVSRYHAELRWENGQPWLVDLASLNGTRINQLTVVGRAPLQDHDLLEFGNHRFRFLLRDGTDSSVDTLSEASKVDSTPEVETRKTAGISGSFGSSAPILALIWSEGAAQEKRWLLAAPITTIGRDATCGVTLSDDSVSRLHAQIARQPSGYFIVDVESKNGVFLNGEQVIGPARLFSGDMLRLGDVILTIRDATSNESDAQAASNDGANISGSVPLDARVGSRNTSKPRFAPPRLTSEESVSRDEV